MRTTLLIIFSFCLLLKTGTSADSFGDDEDLLEYSGSYSDLSEDDYEESGSGSGDDEYYDEDEEGNLSSDDFPLVVGDDDEFTFMDEKIEVVNVKPSDTVPSTPVTSTGKDSKNKFDSDKEGTYIIANRVVLIVIYGAAVLGLFFAILIVFCLLFGLKRKKNKKSLVPLTDDTSVEGSLLKHKHDSILIVDSYDKRGWTS